MLSTEISYWREVPAKQVVQKRSSSEGRNEENLVYSWKPDLVGKFHPNTNHEQNPTPGQYLLNLRYHLNQELQLNTES
jgi:hypothetical protein